MRGPIQGSHPRRQLSVVAVKRYLRLHYKLPPHRQLQAQRLLQVPREGGHRAGRARQRGVRGRGARLASRNFASRNFLCQRGRRGGEEGAGAGDRGQLERDCLLLLLLMWLLLRDVLFSVLFDMLLFGFSLHAGGAEVRSFQGSGWPVSQTTVDSTRSTEQLGKWEMVSCSKYALQNELSK